MSSTEPSECKNCFGKNTYYQNSEDNTKYYMFVFMFRTFILFDISDHPENNL